MWERTVSIQWVVNHLAHISVSEVKKARIEFHRVLFEDLKLD